MHQAQELRPQDSPIKRLPIELLSHVFVCALPAVHSANDVQAPSIHESPLNISHVCQDWRSLALSTPQLWTRIYFNYNDHAYLSRMYAAANAAVTFVERSAKCPLIIHVQGRLCMISDEQSYEQMSAEWVKVGSKLVMALLRVQPQWRLVKIGIDSAIWYLGYEENAERTLDQCSSIEELQFWLYLGRHRLGPHGQAEPFLNLRMSSWTYIRRLQLGDWSCRLADDTFPTFSHLTSFRIPWSSLNSMDVIFKILQCTSLMEELEIKVTYTDFEPDSEVKLLHLPRLRRLHVIGFEDSRPRIMPYARARQGDIVNILNRLTTPALEYLNLSTGDVDDCERVLESMIRLLERSTVSLLVLILQVGRVPIDLLLRGLKSAPRLEKFSFAPFYFNPEHLLRSLTVSPVSPEDAVLCPCLHTLTLQDPDIERVTKTISQLLLSRSPPDQESYNRTFAAGAPPEGGTTVTQKARYGTTVLRTFRVASVHDTGGIDDVDSDAVYESETVICGLWEEFSSDHDIAAMLSRGLKLNLRARWG